jgi:hypothetical protein
MNRTIIAIAAIAIATPAIAQGWDYRNDSNSPKIIAPDGTYRGNLNNNPYDPNSVANPYGKFGNPYSSDSVNNQFGTYGNPYSNQFSNPNGRR